MWQSRPDVHSAQPCMSLYLPLWDDDLDLDASPTSKMKSQESPFNRIPLKQFSQLFPSYRGESRRDGFNGGTTIAMRLLTRPGLARTLLQRDFSSRRLPTPTPTANSRPASVATSPPPTHENNTPPSVAGTGRRTPQARPLIYSCAVFLIIGCGAITGAIFRNDHQRVSEQARQEAGQIDFQKHIDDLQTKRAYLLGEQMQLERKIAALQDKRKLEVIGEGQPMPQQEKTALER